MKPWCCAACSTCPRSTSLTSWAYGPARCGATYPAHCPASPRCTTKEGGCTSASKSGWSSSSAPWRPGASGRPRGADGRVQGTDGRYRRPGVAELANTYGGPLLIGVTDKTRVVRGVKEMTIDSVAEHCHAKIEPPWVREIISVPVGQGSDLYVLVLRVVPGLHPRPLLVDGVAHVRDQPID
ncbi:ATP-binding protein [Streptomyces sp. NPDC001663]|uniref:ATP-binding protein n=1 Tax=Streptomyces sp. NPDC001663 TaxID=3364597 RepID=UPI0036B344F5